MTETATDVKIQPIVPVEPAPARILDVQVTHLPKGGSCVEGLRYAPLADRIVILPRREERDISPEGEETLASGIIKPAVSVRGERTPEEGRVVAVGPGRRYWNGDMVPCAPQVGDWVIYDKFTGDKIEIDGVIYLEMFERSIKGIRPGV